MGVLVQALSMRSLSVRQAGSMKIMFCVRTMFGAPTHISTGFFCAGRLQPPTPSERWEIFCAGRRKTATTTYERQNTVTFFYRRADKYFRSFLFICFIHYSTQCSCGPYACGMAESTVRPGVIAIELLRYGVASAHITFTHRRIQAGDEQRMLRSALRQKRTRPLTSLM